jgi:hypothetical protein
MYSEAAGWVRSLWYMHTDDRIIALLFSAQATLFH